MHTAIIQRRAIMTYHPHLHVTIRGAQYVFCADLSEFILDEELDAKVKEVLGGYETLLDTPDAAKKALADHDIVEVHLHKR